MSSPSRLRRLLAALYRIHTDDEDVARRGRALLTVLFAFGSSFLAVGLVALAYAPAERLLPTLVVVATLALICVISGDLARRGRVDVGGLLISGALSLAIAAYLLYVRDYTHFLWFMTLSVVVASITVRPRLIWVAAGVNFGLLALLALVLPQDPAEKVRISAMLAALLLPTTVFTYLSARRTHALFTAQASALRELERAKALLDDALVTANIDRHRAEAANRTKSTFLANMSHELRTPLNAIIGYAELLEEDAADPEVARDLGRIEQAGQHLLAIIDDILDLSRVEAGKLSINPAPVDLHALVRELRETITPTLARGRNTLEIVHDPACAGVRADPLRLKQILLNLLANATKFTEEGRITLRITAVSADPDAGAAARVRFDVIDTGIGMDSATLARVFDDFTQADASSTRLYGGTGLGLSLSRRLARLLGATLTATSEPARGSTFTLTLPTE